MQDIVLMILDQSDYCHRWQVQNRQFTIIHKMHDCVGVLRFCFWIYKKFSWFYIYMMHLYWSYLVPVAVRQGIDSASKWTLAFILCSSWNWLFSNRPATAPVYVAGCFRTAVISDLSAMPVQDLVMPWLLVRKVSELYWEFYLCHSWSREWHEQAVYQVSLSSPFSTSRLLELMLKGFTFNFDLHISRFKCVTVFKSWRLYDYIS